MKNKIYLLSFASIALILLLFLGVVGFTRIQASKQNRNYFSCKLTGKETTFIQCDERMDKRELSGEQVSFISPQGFAAVYLPFTTSTIDLIFNESTKVSYDYWILYDNFGWKELQKVNGEIINDSSEENLKKSLAYKRNENFLFAQEINGQKRISINTKKTFTTNQNVGYIDSIKNSFLTKGKNPKGAIIMLMGKGSNEKIVITRE